MRGKLKKVNPNDLIDITWKLKRWHNDKYAFLIPKILADKVAWNYSFELPLIISDWILITTNQKLPISQIHYIIPEQDFHKFTQRLFLKKIRKWEKELGIIQNS